jgi:hypothetical protein
MLHIQDTLDMEPCCPGSCNDVSSCPIYHSNLDLDSDVTVSSVVADDENNFRDSNPTVLPTPLEESSRVDHPIKVSFFISL